MTDCMVVGALLLCAFWVLDPAHIGLDRLTVVKHLPFFFLLGALVLAGTGSVLFPRRDTPSGSRGILSAYWPLLVFAGGVLAGSLYGRFVDGVENSFLNMGLLMLVAPVMAWFTCKAEDPARFARACFWALGSVAALDGLVQIAHFGSGTYFHGTEYAVIPLAAYCWFAARSWPGRLLGTGFFLALAPAEHKNTGYMLAIFVVAYCGFWSFRTRYQASRDGLARERQLGWAVFLATGLMAVGLSFYALRKIFLPTGNPEYRLHTYEKAFDKFLDSPLVGTLFSTPATERFELYQVSVSSSNVLPTHSDPLDILANGGLLYSLLFIYGIWRVSRMMFNALDDARHSPLADCAPPLHGCLVILLSGIIVFSFNPVLTQPNAAMVFWAATGLGLGLALRMRAAALAAVSPPAGRSREAGVANRVRPLVMEPR